MLDNFTWRVSDCEELVGHPIEHIGINASNYFMYNGWGQCAPLLCYSVRETIPRKNIVDY